MARLKIFITGHKGFLGSNLVEILKTDTDFKVITFNGNLLDEKELDAFFIKYKPNIVIHLAAVFSKDSSFLLKNNVLLTNLIAKYSKKYEVQKIIFSSTGAVYGSYKNEAYSENDQLKPVNFYGLSKKFAEETLFMNQCHNCYKLIILRFSNIYDKNSGNGVISNFLNDIKSKNKLTIHGSGNQRRDFLHVSDACLAIKKTITFHQSEIFNISSKNNISINELVQLFQNKYTFEVIREQSKDELTNLNLNFSKAKKLLTYYPLVNKIEI